MKPTMRYEKLCARPAPPRPSRSCHVPSPFCLVTRNPCSALTTFTFSALVTHPLQPPRGAPRDEDHHQGSDHRG